MSQTYEPNPPEREHGQPAGPGFAGGAGYPGGYSWADYDSATAPVTISPRLWFRRGGGGGALS